MIYDLFFAFILFVYTGSVFFAGAACNDESEGGLAARGICWPLSMVLFLIILVIGVRT